jgi:hypothetical protein
MEALGFAETSVFTRVAWHNIPEDGILNGNLPWSKNVAAAISKAFV